MLQYTQPVINHTPAKEKGLGYSLFQRYAKIHETFQSGDVEFEMPSSANLDSMLMLTTQYRMVLSFFISLIDNNKYIYFILA